MLKLGPSYPSLPGLPTNRRNWRRNWTKNAWELLGKMLMMGGSLKGEGPIDSLVLKSVSHRVRAALKRRYVLPEWKLEQLKAAESQFYGTDS
jgi:hypothetical protein